MHPGGISELPDAIRREAYSHELSSAGFWPGGDATDYPASFDSALGEFHPPCGAVAAGPDPDAVLLAFLQSIDAAGRTRPAAVHYVSSSG